LIDSFTPNQIEFELGTKYGLPTEVVDKFKGIAFSTSMTFQSFCFVLSRNQGSIEEYVGAAYQDNGNIKLAYISVHAQGNLIPQYVLVTKRECQTIFFFFEDCYDRSYTYARGYTTDELNAISVGLRASAYNHLSEKVQNLRSDTQFILVQRSFLYSTSRNFFTVMQEDGNLVVYSAAGLNGQPRDVAQWSTSTYQQPGKRTDPYSLNLLNDGNLVIHDRNSNVLWESRTANQGESPHSLIMQDDGNLVLYDKNKKPTWDWKQINRWIICLTSRFIFLFP